MKKSVLEIFISKLKHKIPEFTAAVGTFVLVYKFLPSQHA